jgi:hypothetical protein
MTDEVDACRFCGDPLNCDDSCEVDRVRQEEANAAILRIAEARVRKSRTHTEELRELDELLCDLSKPSPLFDSYKAMMTRAYKEVHDG